MHKCRKHSWKCILWQHLPLITGNVDENHEHVHCSLIGFGAHIIRASEALDTGIKPEELVSNFSHLEPNLGLVWVYGYNVYRVNVGIRASRALGTGLKHEAVSTLSQFEPNLRL